MSVASARGEGKSSRTTSGETCYDLADGENAQMAMIFDTLKLSKSLREAEFTDSQADALATALSEQVQDTPASKADLLHLEITIGAKLTELSKDNSDLRADMVDEFAKVRTEMSLMRTDMIKWIVTAIAFNDVATAGLFVTFFKLFVK